MPVYFYLNLNQVKKPTNLLLILLLITTPTGTSIANAKNQLPIINAGDDIVTQQQRWVRLRATANDPDGRIVAYQWRQTAGINVVLNHSNLSYVGFDAPKINPNSENINLRFRVTATDDKGNKTHDSIKVTVLANTPPTVKAILAESPAKIDSSTPSVTENRWTRLFAQADDHESDIISYKWVQISGTKVDFNDSNRAYVGFKSPQTFSNSEDLLFRAIVTDKHDARASDIIKVTVKAKTPKVQARLTWTPPTENTDGSTLNNLSGFIIYYGKSSSELKQSIQIHDPNITSYTINDLDEDSTYYFRITAINSLNTQSEPSKKQYKKT